MKGQSMPWIRKFTIYMKRTWVLLGAGCVWLVLIGIGEVSLLKYDFRPGVHSHAPEIWPVKSQIKPVNNLPILVMFAHPKCPCTRASIGELAKLVAHTQGKLSIYVLFVTPANASSSWTKTDLWEAAVHIPSVHVAVDIESREANRFNSTTSGQTLLYDSHGRLLFSGGITDSRGHSGDNRGRAIIESFLTDGVPVGPSKHTPVFGCFLPQPRSSNLLRSSS